MLASCEVWGCRRRVVLQTERLEVVQAPYDGGAAEYFSVHWRCNGEWLATTASKLLAELLVREIEGVEEGGDA